MQMGKESISQCPLMKGTDETSSGAHKEHHEEQKWLLSATTPRTRLERPETTHPAHIPACLGGGWGGSLRPRC